MNCECWHFSKSQMPYRNTVFPSGTLQKYCISVWYPTEKQYFCRGQRHWNTSYYTNFKCQTWTWNQCPNMGNDVRGRENSLWFIHKWRHSKEGRRRHGDMGKGPYEISSNFRKGFALSKWPNFCRAYLLGVSIYLFSAKVPTPSPNRDILSQWIMCN